MGFFYWFLLVFVLRNVFLDLSLCSFSLELMQNIIDLLCLLIAWWAHKLIFFYFKFIPNGLIENLHWMEHWGLLVFFIFVIPRVVMLVVSIGREILMLWFLLYRCIKNNLFISCGVTRCLLRTYGLVFLLWLELIHAQKKSMPE